MGAVIGDDVLAGLGEGVTDHGLRALADAGCGRKLTHLTLGSEFSSRFCACRSCFRGWGEFVVRWNGTFVAARKD